jgi:hypothetical protein
VNGVALWALGISLAFLATAGAFLLLANLGGGAAASDPIPQTEVSGEQDSEPALVLNLPEDRLETLEKRPGQKLALDVKNGDDEEFPSVDLALDIVSENTARPRLRSYQQRVEHLAPGEVATVEFEVDLSPPIEGKAREVDPGIDPRAREILEIRGSTPQGVSAVKTAVLAP